MRKRNVLVLLLALSLLLTGCSESERLEDRLIVQSLAIDFEEGYRVTAKAYRPKEDGDAPLVTAEGESLSQALEGIKKASGRLPFYSELSSIVIGASAARQGLKELLQGIGREKGIRKGVYLFYTPEKAADCLSLEKVSDEEWINLAENQLSRPILEQSRLFRVAGRFHQSGQDGFLPMLYPTSSDRESGYRIDRVVCLKGENIAVILDAHQTQTLGWILGGMSAEYHLLDTPRGRVVLKPQAARSFFTQDALCLHQTLSCDFLDSSLSEKEGKAAREEIADWWQKQMHQRVEDLIEAVYQKAQSDVFSFGLRGNDPQKGHPTVEITLKIKKD